MQENTEKNPKSPTYGNRKNIGKVLNFLYLAQKPVRISDILRNVGLKRKQIYKSLEFLGNVNAVTKEYEIRNRPGKNQPPYKRLIIRLTEYQRKNAKRYLRR